jgi:DNA-binding protein
MDAGKFLRGIVPLISVETRSRWNRNQTNGGHNMAEDDSIVYIGKKPTMNYVLAVATRFNSGTSTVTIKARGKSISTAVDVAEIVRNRFIQDLKVDDIRISTEVLEGEEGKTSNVSSIEIFLKK